MGRLFDRRWRVTAAGVDVSDLDLDFDTFRSTKREPNAGNVTIYNLGPTLRAQVHEGGELQIRAGYVDDGDPPPLLFVGDIRRAWTERSDQTFATRVEARDGGTAYYQARISRSYAPGTAVSTALQDAVSAMGIGEGNLSEFADAYRLRNGSAVFASGYAMSGPVRRALNDLVRGAGLRWSVQNGALQLQRRGQPLQTRAALLSPSSGLVESPSADDKGIVTAVSLLQTGLDPGRRVVLDSSTVSGTYEIIKNETKGSTQGQDWHATLELRPIS